MSGNGLRLICVNTGGHPDLTVGQIYTERVDAEALKEGLIQVLDDSGEPRLYPQTLFDAPPDEGTVECYARWVDEYTDNGIPEVEPGFGTRDFTGSEAERRRREPRPPVSRTEYSKNFENTGPNITFKTEGSPSEVGIPAGARLWYRNYYGERGEWVEDRSSVDIPASELTFLNRYPARYGFLYYFTHRLHGRTNQLKTYTVY